MFLRTPDLQHKSGVLIYKTFRQLKSFKISLILSGRMEIVCVFMLIPKTIHDLF